MIYLDNAATTKMSDKAVEEQLFWACSNFYNPSATYSQAVKVSFELSNARTRLKKLLGVKNGDIIFTSGATEANNLAIRGSERNGDWEYVFSSGEHASVYNLAKQLELEGKVVKYVPLVESGEIYITELEKALSTKTRVVSIIFVNNVTGAINNIKEISKIVRNKSPKAILHIDGVQAFCKIPFKLSELDVDLFSISAHKFHGPKGVGALYVKNKSSLKSIVYGGGQEFGIRSGTENVPGIMSMTVAAENIDIKSNYEKVKLLREKFEDAIRDDKIKLVSTQNGSPYILSLLFEGINGETLVRILENDIIVGRGSACSSKKAGNHVLQAMDYSAEQIKGAIRVSFDSSLTEEQVVYSAEKIKNEYLSLLEKLK